MLDGTVVVLCGHCGNLTAFQILKEYNYLVEPEENHPGDEFKIWRILQCLTCKKVMLDETYKVLDDGKLVYGPKRTVLYPVERNRLIDLPKAVEKEYTSALKYQNSDPNVCAVYIGRTLDKICQHEKVKGNRLIDKLDNLIKEKNLPEQLAKMAHQIRQIRNLGAHADENDDEVTEADAPVMLDFLTAILEYLYVAPAKIAAVQARLKKTP